VTPTEGYFGSLTDGKDTLTAIRTYRLEAESWAQTVQEIRVEVAESQAGFTRGLSDIEESINQEREAWQDQLSRERRKWVVYTLGALALGYVVGD
jgi:hypothetical protein